jgi:hypothetical protein
LTPESHAAPGGTNGQKEAQKEAIEDCSEGRKESGEEGGKELKKVQCKSGQVGYPYTFPILIVTLHGTAASSCGYHSANNEGDMGRGILFWRLGVPIPTIVVLLLLG